MKKFIYLLVAAMLGSACADEKPHFLPLPGGSVEIGGIGATAPPRFRPSRTAI